MNLNEYIAASFSIIIVVWLVYIRTFVSRVEGVIKVRGLHPFTDEIYIFRLLILIPDTIVHKYLHI